MRPRVKVQVSAVLPQQPQRLPRQHAHKHVQGRAQPALAATRQTRGGGQRVVRAVQRLGAVRQRGPWGNAGKVNRKQCKSSVLCTGCSTRAKGGLHTCGRVMGQGLDRLARSRRVQLMPIPQADGKQFAVAEQKCMAGRTPELLYMWTYGR